MEGARYVLSPDALTALCPAKNPTSGSVFPASIAVMESEKERQLFSEHEIYPLLLQQRDALRTGSKNYLHIVTYYIAEIGTLTSQWDKT